MKTLLYTTFLVTVMAFCPSVFANGDAPGAPYYGKHAAPVQVTLVPGSLRANIERIGRQAGWKKVVWNSPDDFKWATYTKVKQDRLQDVLRMILADYPLQAIFYEGNHVLEIRPRTPR